MAKLSWNPPKWKRYHFDGINFIVELETGNIYKGHIQNDNYIQLEYHSYSCFDVFGTDLGGKQNSDKISELSQVLNLNLNTGYWPECSNVKKFLKRYYERVAKIENSFKIYIKTEFNITPKFTL